MKFSIVVPTYNSAATLDRTIQSVLSQNYKQFELLILDGMSSDDTVMLIKKYEAINNNISWVSRRDRGVYDAMNSGIKMATGEYLYFLGSDDALYNENVLATVCEAITQNDYPDFVYGNVYSPDLGEKFDGRFDEEKIIEKNICHQAIFYKKTVFDRLKRYNIHHKILADYELNLRCFFNKAISKLYIDEIIAFYAPGGLSRTITYDQFINERDKFIRRHGWEGLPYHQLKQYYKTPGSYLFDYFKRKFFSVFV